MSCRLQLAGEVFTLSAEAAAMSAVIVTMTQRDDDEGDTVPHDVDEAMPLPVECVTARGLSAAVGFMERRGTASTTRARPSVLATPLWFDEGAVPATPWAALGLRDGEDDEALVQDLWRDGGLLVEVARTADFLQVDALLELCCGVLAVAMGQAGRTAMRLDGLSAMVLTKALTLMPTRAKDKALESYAAVRNAVGVFVVERWFADLRAMSREEGGGRRSQQPWLMCPRSMVSVERGDVAMTRLANEVGQYMLERRFVPVGLTAERLAEQLEDVLATTGDLRGAKVGLFSVSVTGPLGAWLPHALDHFNMCSWFDSFPEFVLDEPPTTDRSPFCVLRTDFTFGSSSSGDVNSNATGSACFMAVMNSAAQHALRSTWAATFGNHVARQHAVVTEVWCSGGAAGVRRTAVMPDDNSLILVAADNERFAFWVGVPADATSLGVRADWLVLAYESRSPLTVTIGADAWLSSRLRIAANSTIHSLKWRGGNPSRPELVDIDLSLCSRLRMIGPSFGSFSGVTCVDVGGWTATFVSHDFFAHCPALTTLACSAPCKMESIGDDALFRCTSLTQVDLSRCRNLRALGSRFASHCAVTSLDLGGWSAKQVSYDFFAANASLTSVTASAPCGLERFGDRAFYRCASLTHVDLGKLSQLHSIGSHFSAETAVTSLDLTGWAVADVGHSFFADCESLTSVAASAPCGMKRIGANAFRCCTALARLDLATLLPEWSIGFHFAADTPVQGLHLSGVERGHQEQNR